MDNQRLTDLEIRYSHQEEFIQQLNSVVVAQQATIERLEKEILDLKRAVNSEDSISGSRNPADHKPPHY